MTTGDLTGRLDHLMMALQQEGRTDDAATVHEALDELSAVPPAVEAPERWAIVSLFGHAERVGRISDIDDGAMKRVDIPLGDGSFSTRDIGRAAIYEITYVTEEVARAVAKARPAHPVSAWSARNLGLLPPAAAPELLTAADVDRDAFLADAHEEGDGEDEEDAEYGPCPDGDQIDQVGDARVEDGAVPGRETVEEAMAADLASGLPF